MTKPTPQTPHHSAAPRGQEGFTMIVVMLVLLVTSLLLVAAFTAANGEVHLTNTDRAEKKAYYAAEAGVEDYEYHLTQDGNYLSYCTEPPSANPALNQVKANPLKKATVPSTSSEPTNEQYAIQLLPAESNKEATPQCNKSNLVESMIEEKTGGPVGTFRIESTGYSGGAERTIVATFRNANFVSYVWYTKYETGDPVIYGKVPQGLPSNYFEECANFYGKRPGQGGNPFRCANNFFISTESVNGPMHTEDHAGVCGSPVFGRNENDRIEFGNGGNTTTENYSNEGCGPEAAPVFKGKHIPTKEVLSIEPPPGDEELKHIVEPRYLFKEKTEIVLEKSTMTIVEHKGAGVLGGEKTESGVAYPPNGVIYVEGACSEPYSPYGPKPRYFGNEVGAETDTKCGNVYVHGVYTNSLTIGAENDVIINGNITTPVSGETPTSNALLGLIANSFVRVYHPVVEAYEGHTPELKTTSSQLELEGAAHKETITVEALSSALAKEVRVEVKKISSSEYEVVIFKGVTEVEHTAPLKKAEQLVGLASSYVTYKQGPKYAEGAGERLKRLAAESMGYKVIKVEPKSPKVGKELQVEVKEKGSEDELTLFNESGVEQEKTTFKTAEELLIKKLMNVTFAKGSQYAKGEKEKLKESSKQWLDEKCNQNGQEEVEKFVAGVRMCEYTDEPNECDAPDATTKDLNEPVVYAAMLAVKHGVIVDNFTCGAPTLGPLKIYGAVAGLYTNGFTGEFNGSTDVIEHGYPYDANYDNRLQVEEPPHFLNPVEAAWYVQRQSIAPNP
jgi:Tfp pilus assembly protein PilX